MEDKEDRMISRPSGTQPFDQRRADRWKGMILNQRDVHDIWGITLCLAVLFVVGILVLGVWKVLRSNDRRGTRPGRQIEQFISPGR